MGQLSILASNSDPAGIQNLTYPATAMAEQGIQISFNLVNLDNVNSGNLFAILTAVSPTTVKFAGDVNNDGAIDITDLILVYQSQFRKPGAVGVPVRADVNKDGNIDITDQIIVYLNQFKVSFANFDLFRGTIVAGKSQSIQSPWIEMPHQDLTLRLDVGHY